jgi:C4-dicarboxylate-specific signal transduction histidine kinase
MGIDSEKCGGLRRHAEKPLQSKTAELHIPRTNEEIRRLVHELEVHKIELEAQNAELQQAKNQLEELNMSLEVLIAQAVDELRQKDQMLILQDRQAIMGEMINNIAHQWRQPLNMLGLIIQNLPMFYDTVEFNREFLEENTGKSMELILHMSRTIDDFRNFFKSDKKKLTFNINQVITQTLSIIGQSFQNQNISIAFDPEGSPMANGYPNEYTQVLLNILMNARDALVEHNVDSALISIHAFEEAGTSVVIISDNAGGIAEEIIDKLFDPYFSTKVPDKGTGIGLFMSKTIIEKNMGGKLTVRNTVSGAEFRIEV